MIKKTEETKKRINIYIEESLNQCKYSVSNSRKANIAYRRLLKILNEIKKGTLDKDILLDLIENDYPEVRYNAAADLLELNYEVELALSELKKIETSEYESIPQRMLSFNAKMVREKYKKDGILDIK
jgi:hypothetical protein